MKSTKTFKIVMLPTEKAENCIAMYHNRKISWSDQLLTSSYRESANIKVFQLYILSDDQIKEGDWFVNMTNNKVYPCDINNKLMVVGYQHLKKIIATTDAKITSDYTTPGVTFVPSIPDSFIHAYIIAYNENKSINEVNLERTNPNNDHMDFGGPYIPTTIKTRPDNTVIIHPSKTYTKDEVLDILRKFADECENNEDLFSYEGRNIRGEKNLLEVQKWAEDNL